MVDFDPGISVIDESRHNARCNKSQHEQGPKIVQKLAFEGIILSDRFDPSMLKRITPHA